MQTMLSAVADKRKQTMQKILAAEEGDSLVDSLWHVESAGQTAAQPKVWADDEKDSAETAALINSLDFFDDDLGVESWESGDIDRRLQLEETGLAATESKPQGSSGHSQAKESVPNQSKPSILMVGLAPVRQTALARDAHQFIRPSGLDTNTSVWN